MDETLMSQAQEPVQQEQMLPQSKVNELVGTAKAMAYEKAKRELMQQQQQQQPMMQAQPMQQAQGQQMQSGVSQEEAQELARMAVQQEMEALRAQEEERLHRERATQIAKSYLDKMSKGTELYQDFEAVTSEVDPAAFRHVIALASQSENTADVMYELAKNPINLAGLNYLAQTQPQLAMKHLKGLEDSIKANRDAMAKMKQTQSPLPNYQPSQTAGADSGAVSLKDLKRMFKV
jgi:hypothetical protein